MSYAVSKKGLKQVERDIHFYDGLLLDMQLVRAEIKKDLKNS